MAQGNVDGSQDGALGAVQAGESAGWVLSGGSQISVALRSGRRRLGWNQRELARESGLSQSTIARMEAGADARFSAVVAALSACGLLVVAAPPAGAPQEHRVVPHPADDGRDTSGRRLPAHLPAYPTTMLPTYTMWKRMVRGENVLTPRTTHWLYAREPWMFPPEAPPGDVPAPGGSNCDETSLPHDVARGGRPESA